MIRNITPQVTLKAIPQRTGRVRDWLGPSYLDEEIDVVCGSPVRVLKTDKYFRNAFANTSLGIFPSTERLTLNNTNPTMIMCM